jgi:hypothetical protein
VQNGFPHGFAGNGACIDTDAAHYVAHFDERNAFAPLYRRDGSALSGGARADDEKIICFHDKKGTHPMKKNYPEVAACIPGCNSLL